MVFGKKRRRAEEREHLAWLFTRLLLLSEERGLHATGAAWLDADGGHRLFKRPVTAERFVTDKALAELLASMDNRATLLLGHTPGGAPEGTSGSTATTTRFEPGR